MGKRCSGSCTSCRGIGRSHLHNLNHDVQQFAGIVRVGSPFAVAQVLHVDRTAPAHQIEAGINARVVQGGGGAVGFQMLHLGPHAHAHPLGGGGTKFGGVEVGTGGPSVCSAQTTEIELVQRSGGGEVTGFNDGLAEGHQGVHALCGPLFQVDLAQLIQGPLESKSLSATRPSYKPW